MSAGDNDLRAIQAADAGKEFATLFYDKLDKSRNKMAGFFLEAAHLVWNGRSIRGRDSIVSFYENLPQSHSVLMSVDSQPILDLPEFAGQATISVICGGKMKFMSDKPRDKFFTEVFMLTAENNSWKIVSDNFRDYS